MVINRNKLLELAPIKDMCMSKMKHSSGTSYGLSEAGYDIRLKQDILFKAPSELLEDQMFYAKQGYIYATSGSVVINHNMVHHGRFIIASSVEEFQMPHNLMAIVHDKSTWARQGLSVFNTVIEPGWNGFLTLELIYHGNSTLHLPAGCGIAQVIFHELQETYAYQGKYQNQPDKPIESIWEKD